MFGHSFTIIYNQIFAVASIASTKIENELQKISTRYFFSQFWSEFTKEVLTEFYLEDLKSQNNAETYS